MTSSIASDGLGDLSLLLVRPTTPVPGVAPANLVTSGWCPGGAAAIR